MKSAKPRVRHPPATTSALAATPEEQAFAEVVDLIQASRGRALAVVNTTLIDLYWRVGEYISRKLGSAAWGEGVVTELANYIQRRHPSLRGFTRRNLFRMRHFFDAYGKTEVVPALLTQLPWTHHLLILGRCKRSEEREFYVRLAIQEKWSSRDLERQLEGALFERAVLNPPKVSTALKQLRPGALLFFHRGLNCLVAIELKIGEFQPEHLGKLNFYLEALDRDVRKGHEGPSIGVLLCASKDDEVVEYALSRSLSPALVAEYQTQLPDKKMLQAKLHELYALTATEAE